MHANLQENLSIKSDFALFNNIKSITAKQAHKSLRNITRQLSTPIESIEKDTLLIGPYKLGPEQKRANRNIESVSALVFDIDEPKGYTFDDIIALTSEYFGVVHTTWSHTMDHPRYRLVIHLREEIPANDFVSVRDNFLFFNSELALIVDKACSDISRAYYWFSYPPEKANDAHCCVLMGSLLDPSNLKTPKFLAQTRSQSSIVQSQLQNILQGGAAEGSRNKHLASLVGGLIKKGLTRTETYDQANQWNQTLSAPLPSDEVERTHNSIWNTHLRNNSNCEPIRGQTHASNAERFNLIPAAGLLATLPPKRDWVIQDFLPSKIVAAVVAAGGTGKSYFAMHTAVSIASGTHLFSKYQPKAAAKVIFISGEDDASELQRRLHKAVSGLSSQARALVNQNLHFIDLADSFELFTEKNNKGEIDITKIPSLICEQINSQVGPDIGLVIVDPVARFRGGDENFAADATRFVQALQQIRDQLNTTVLCLHHVNKGAGAGGNQNNARGSSAFIDGVRLVFQLNTLLEPEIRKLYGNPLALPPLLTLQSVKSNYGKPAEPMILARRDDGSLELFDVIAEDHQQNDLLKEIEVCKLSKTQFKGLYGGVKKKFGLAEKALLEKLEQLNREGLITIPNRGVMTVTESGKKVTTL
ncbi:AAA family ATPase [Polynucleobacter sp. UB-Siik-W21]|uniref:AAA family ATPase n=1 Tax=Polynucleobacter sp. UB-Siik-W21 TaxID=1855646 RepID=UPI001BFE7F8C|nr:AAA family ATPase [Polynucleobacter sp. UB-Siik-W21]QWD69657.1 AAA family ATPase [Polynucleobacter sp. UB-Siik-W21]